MKKRSMNVSKLTFAALMTAMICVVAPFSIPLPLSAVPISLAPFAIFISASIIGWKLGVISVAVYLLLGMVGVPVFAGWSAGAQVLVGPTGGYLIGFLFMALFTGISVEVFEGNIVLHAIGMAIGTVCCYVIGTIWLSLQLDLSFSAALTAGVIPFIPGDVAKIIAAVALCHPLRKQVKHLLV